MAAQLANGTDGSQRIAPLPLPLPAPCHHNPFGPREQITAHAQLSQHELLPASRGKGDDGSSRHGRTYEAHPYPTERGVIR